MDNRILQLFEERINHPFYPNMDINKLNKKKITMTMDELVKERQNILKELLSQIYALDKLNEKESK